MIIINDGIPIEAYQLIINNKYEPGNPIAFCSATSLLKPPKEFWLMRRFGEQIEVGASHFLESIYGTVWHLGFEQLYNNNKRYIQEERMYFSIDIDGKQIIITGKPDLYNKETETLTDFKETSVWTIIYESKIDDWEKQLNIYAYAMNYGYWTDDLLNYNHNKFVEISTITYNVSNLQVLYKCRDWRKSESLRDTFKYPQKVAIRILRLYEKEECEAMIQTLVKNLLQYKDTDPNEIPECNKEQRWQKPTTYAVMKKGRKSAVRVVNTIEQAKGIIYNVKKDKDKHYVETRESQPTKCNEYCFCNKLCNWYQNYIMEQ